MILWLLLAIISSNVRALPTDLATNTFHCNATDVENTLRDATRLSQNVLANIDNPTSADLYTMIFGTADKTSVKTVYAGIIDDAHHGPMNIITYDPDNPYYHSSRIQCDPLSITPPCKDAAAYNMPLDLPSSPLITLCRDWFHYRPGPSCDNISMYADYRTTDNRAATLIHELSHSQRPNGTSVDDNNHDGTIVYTKSGILALAKSYTRDPQHNKSPARIAAAYAWFAQLMHDSWAAECQAYVPPEDSACGMKYYGAYDHVAVRIKPTPPDPRGCGRGLLDNLRGQCGIVTDWRCEEIDGMGFHASFDVALQMTDRCVRDAIWLASGKEGVRCDTDLAVVLSQAGDETK